MEKATVRDILKSPYRKMSLSPRMRQFLGAVPADKQFSIALKGKPGSGKSTFVLKYLCEEFAKHGKLLYFTAEENLFAGTIKRRLQKNKVTPHNKIFVSDKYFETLCEELRTGEYRFCVIDSINKLRSKGDEKPVLAKEVMQLIDTNTEFPNVSFIFIVQLDALMKRAAGGAASQYDTDILIDCMYDKNTEERWAEISNGKNRFNDENVKFVMKEGVK